MFEKRAQAAVGLFFAAFLAFGIFTKCRVLAMAERPEAEAEQRHADRQFVACVLPDQSGRLVDVQRLARDHRVTLVPIWGTFCGSCLQELPQLSELHRAYEDQGLMVIGINIDENAAFRNRYLAEHPLPFPILNDPKTTVLDACVQAGILKEHIIPTVIALNQHGEVIGTEIGANADGGPLRAKAKQWLKQSSTPAN